MGSAGRRDLEPLTSGATPPPVGGLHPLWGLHQTAGSPRGSVTSCSVRPGCVGRCGLEPLTSGAAPPVPGGFAGGWRGGGGGGSAARGRRHCLGVVSTVAVGSGPVPGRGRPGGAGAGWGGGGDCAWGGSLYPPVTCRPGLAVAANAPRRAQQKRARRHRAPAVALRWASRAACRPRRRCLGCAPFGTGHTPQ